MTGASSTSKAAVRTLGRKNAISIQDSREGKGERRVRGAVGDGGGASLTTREQVVRRHGSRRHGRAGHCGHRKKEGEEFAHNPLASHFSNYKRVLRQFSGFYLGPKPFL